MTRDEALALYNSGAAPAVEALCDLSDTAEAQRKQIQSLELKIAKLSKNSSNSSKRPSSDDITKKKGKKEPEKKKRKIGGQPGHERNLRDPFAEDEIDIFHPYILTGCPICDGQVDLLDMPPKIIRQMELVEVPVVKEEHRLYPVWCEACRKLHYMPFPENVVKEGLFKARLTATVAYMKNVCHASFSTIRKFIRDVLGEKVSRGYLVTSH